MCWFKDGKVLLLTKVARGKLFCSRLLLLDFSGDAQHGKARGLELLENHQISENMILVSHSLVQLTFLIKSDSNHLLCANIRVCWPFKRKHTSCPLLIFYADSLKTTMCDFNQPENCTEALIDGNVLVLFRSLPVKSKQNWNQRKGSTLKAALCWHIAEKFSTDRI